MALFAGGWVSLALTIISPLDTLGRYYLFSAHTAQLFIIITLSVPLLMAGLPDWLSAWRCLHPRCVRRAAD